ILQDVTQDIDAMDAHVGNGPASGDRPVVEPGAGMAQPGIRELRPRKDGTADVTGGDASAKDRRAFLKAKDLRDAEEYARVARRFDHLAAFVRIHAHRLFAQHRLAGGDRREDVPWMANIGGGD